ncbi:polysaccharide biosynthesis protein [Peribacillus sp. SCS-37]|uniref:polysaccharide biosynthesis protein n=1 Tax=Paraperibacillus esterisolvens TaxID=3115296 RepID=UPI003906054D
MTYRQRLSLFIIIDSCIVLTAIYLGRFLVDPNYKVMAEPIVASSLAIVTSHLFFSFLFHLYRKSWEYASTGELILILKTVTATIIAASLIQLLLFQEISFRLLAVTWMLHVTFICGSRFCWRMFRDSLFTRPSNKKRTMIIGAGSAGMMVARQLQKSRESELLPVCFVDDDPKKYKLEIFNIPVMGGIKKIEEIVKAERIENIIIAIPSLKRKELNAIFKECAKTNAQTKILPRLEDLVTGKVSVNQFRDVQVEDLLGRDPVHLDIDSISGYVTGKTILVSGAGGSIGSEICRQISKFKPGRLILLGHGENSIYSIEMELINKYKDSGIEFFTEIADLQDAQKMMIVMERYLPDVVYHAAAHKHVPLMERNPEEAVKNNLIGTRNIAEAAGLSGVGTFVMISSDKAVNPTSVMGATKRLAEMVIQNLDQSSTTRFVAVRFGNVLGSRGSVIPLFKKQIEEGGPVTITHPDMNRFFMTIPEASKLVIQAGALARGGEIFVLDMGEPVKIVDLAKNLIKLSGNTIEEIGVEFTGMRPGEKLFEELLNSNEINENRVHPKIYVGQSSELLIPEIEELIATFALQNKEAIRQRVLDLANYKSEPVLAY